MVTVEEREVIRRAHLVEGKSIRQIQREFGYHRKTIRKALEGGEVPRYVRRKAARQPVLGAVKAVIEGWLREDEDKPPKQRHTAKRIHERLCSEYGFVGAESTVRHFVSQHKQVVRATVFIPLGYQPGEMAQVDFGEAEVVIAGLCVPVQLFCLRLCYSKQPFVLGLPTQGQEAFFLGHVQAFDFLGGVPKMLVYDNAKVAVKTILEGRSREEQAAFIALRSHYLFESRFCTPGEGHEKGLVEGLVGYVRRNWLVPIPEFASWAALNAFLLEKCQREGQRHLRGLEQTIGQALVLEQGRLRPLPAHPYPCCTARAVRANGFGLVTFQSNRYSVPAVHAHEPLWLRAYVERIEISNGQQVVAVHERCYQREQDILNPLHYLTLLEQRPGAWEQAKPIQAWQKRWPAVYDLYLHTLRQHLTVNQARREFIRILRLHDETSESVIAQALEEALQGHCYSADSVKQLVQRLRQPSQPPAPLDVSQQAQWALAPVEWPSLARFDRLLAHLPGGGT
jgi:transposase